MATYDLHPLQVSAEVVVVEAEPREALCRAVADMDAGMLVVGSRGLGAIKRYVTSDVASRQAVKPGRNRMTHG